MECPICFEQYNDASIRYECGTCETNICLHCLASLKKEECPFCRATFQSSSSETGTNDGVATSSSMTSQHEGMSQSYPPSVTMSQSLPVYTSMWSHEQILGDDGEWRRSRILTRQLRRERKRMDHELQQVRNAELSRLHNRQQPARKNKRGKNQSNMIFDMELDASV